MMTFRKYLAFGLVGLMTGGTTSVLAAGGEGAGLPQLDITTWPNQLFWLVVTFGIGYIIMSRMITPRIGNVLEQRGRTIQDDLNRAKEAEAEAQAAATYADAYGKDPEFYDFYRAMESYRRTFEQGTGDSSMILDQDSEYFRQFRGRR